jgi:hypothetical protein
MEWLLAFSALEMILCIVVTRKLRALHRLQREFRLSMLDLEVAFTFAHQGNFGAAHAAARRWHDRLRAMQRRQPYHPPDPPRTGTAASSIMIH